MRADGEEREVVREAHAELLNTKVYCVVLPVQVTVSLFVSGIANYGSISRRHTRSNTDDVPLRYEWKQRWLQ